MAGMTAAAIVTGNTVVLKPASATPVIAAWMAELFDGELHLPPGVLNFVPGPGGAVGDVLVDHPLTRFIAFTGSKEVGLRIFQRAAAVQPGQKWLKRTILEMGGKDAIVVDETADLDEAAAGIVSARVRLPGPEVLGLLARGGRGRASTTRCWRRSSTRTAAARRGRPGARPGHGHGAGD